MPHESTVAHEYEQRQSREDATLTSATTTTLVPVDEVQNNDVKDVSVSIGFLYLLTLSLFLNYLLLHHTS